MAQVIGLEIARRFWIVRALAIDKELRELARSGESEKIERGNNAGVAKGGVKHAR